MATTQTNADRLVACIADYARCVVAFSGGVDSALVAKAAFTSLQDEAWAVTAVSPSLAAGELEQARRMATLIGIRHEIIHTREFSDPRYVRNEHDRCYFCKSELYNQLELLCERYQDAIIANGTNADDMQDYRPGLKAAVEHRIRSPLVECGLSKREVRELAAFWDLPVWNKPAMPCLSSRVAYGEEVTPDRLRMIDAAEQFLRRNGCANVRVRYHRGDLARLEVPVTQLIRLTTDPLRNELVNHLRQLGFRFITIDMEGFRSGSLNTMVPLEVLQLKAES